MRHQYSIHHARKFIVHPPRKRGPLRFWIISESQLLIAVGEGQAPKKWIMAATCYKLRQTRSMAGEAAILTRSLWQSLANFQTPLCWCMPWDKVCVSPLRASAMFDCQWVFVPHWFQLCSAIHHPKRRPVAQLRKRPSTLACPSLIMTHGNTMAHSPQELEWRGAVPLQSDLIVGLLGCFNNHQ